jgi:hypothetical protein
MNCTECKERLYPENPEVPFYDPHGRKYLPPLCQSCSEPKEEIRVTAIKTETRWNKDQWTIVNQVQYHLLNLDKRVFNLEERQPRRKKSIYKEYL